MREVFWAGVSTLTEEIQTVQRDGLKMKVVMALLGVLGPPIPWGVSCGWPPAGDGAARRIQLTGDTCRMVVILVFGWKKKEVRIVGGGNVNFLLPKREKKEKGKYVLGQCQFGQSLSCSN